MNTSIAVAFGIIIGYLLGVHGMGTYEIVGVAVFAAFLVSLQD